MDGATVKPLTKLNDQNYTLHLRDLLFFARETPACPAYPGGQLASHRAVKLRTRLDAAMVRGRSQTRSRCSSEGGVVRHDLYAEVSYPSGEGPSYCELLTLSARALDAVDRDVRSVKSDGAYL